MQKIGKNILRVVLFFGFGTLLFYFAYRGLDIDTIISALKEANLWWIGASLLLGVISHISRTMRWQLLLEPLGKKTDINNTFFAVMVMYLANLALPRLGEVSRCSIMAKYEKVPFSKGLGTVVVERFVDMLVLIIMFLIVIIFQFDKIFNFLEDTISQKFGDFDIAYMWTGLIVLVLFGVFFIWLVFFKLNHLSIVQKILDFLKSFVEGLKTVAKLEKKGWFIFHSFFIFILYYLMIYVNFFAFDFTSGLSPMAGLTVFVMASLGMVAPAPGGIGAWHFMAFETLAVYGVPINPSGAAFAFAVHGSMTIMLIVVGTLSLVLLPIYNKIPEPIDDIEFSN